jgi:glucoamylase
VAYVHDIETRDTKVGIHVADLPTRDLPDKTEIVFTFFWPEDQRWEGSNFTVEVENAESH